jgi:oligosaccharide repeat unit polymerase
MKKIPNIDFYLLFLMPLALILVMIFYDGKAFQYGTQLVLTLFLYQILIYNKRYIYGYSGVFHFSIPSIILTTFTVFIAIPSVYVCTIRQHANIDAYFYSILSFYYLYPLGLYTAGKIWRINNSKVIQIFHSPILKSKYDYIFADYLYLIIPVLVGILGLYLIRVDQIPLVELFKHPGDYARLSVLRDKAYLVAHISSIEKYLIAWQRAVFIPTSIIASIFLYRLYKQKKYLIMFVCFLVFGVIFNSLTLEKSPVAAIFLALVAFVYLQKKKINFRFLIIAILATLAIPILIMAIKFYREEGLLELLFISISNRIFLVPAKALYVHYVMFPSLHDFLWGRSTNLIAWMHPEGGFPLANYVARFWWKDPHATGTLNATYLAFFWADFGWLGVIVSSFMVGFVTHWLFYLVLKISNFQKNILFVIFTTAMLPAFTFSFFNSNFTILLVTRGVFLTIILLSIIKHLAHRAYPAKST